MELVIRRFEDGREMHLQPLFGGKWRAGIGFPDRIAYDDVW